MSVLLYATSPAMQLVGICEIDSIVEGPPEDIWERMGSQTGIDKAAFDGYFNNCARGTAIRLVGCRRLQAPIPLADLRSWWTWFSPPQSFRYVRAVHAERLPGVPPNFTSVRQLEFAD
jgi:predicted transcriptional regulator